MIHNVRNCVSLVPFMGNVGNMRHDLTVSGV